MAKVVADQRARGGGSGRPMLYVLVASLVLLAVYMAVFLGWSGATSPPSSNQMNSTGATTSSANKSPVDNPAVPAPRP